MCRLTERMLLLSILGRHKQKNTWPDRTSLCLSLSPVSVRHRPVDHLRGPGCDADGSAGPALPGALHSAHQPRCSSVAQGVEPVLDWKWICGEYQFDMTAYRLPKNRKDLKKKQQEKKTEKHLVK